MRRLILPLIVFASVGLVLSIIGLVRTMNRLGRSQPTVVQQDPASIGLKVPEFTLTDQDGNPRTETLFDGKVTILDFFFTHCPFACPMMTLAMQDLARDLPGTDVQFVSITVDPTHDAPARLKAYATEKAIDFSRWTLLTGEEAVIHNITLNSLGFEIRPDSDPTKTIDLPGGGTMPNIMHPSKLLLIGPDRKVLGFYEANSLEETQKLLLRARAAAESLPK